MWSQLRPLLHILFSPWHVLPGQLKQGAELLGYMLSCTAAPKAALSWGRADQKAAPLENGTVLKLKCVICNSGKIFREKKSETV